MKCKKCKKEFVKEYANHQYCDECRFVNCPVCQKVIHTKVGAKEPQKYCSKRCYAISQKGRKRNPEATRKMAETNRGRKTGEFFDCETCGKGVYKYPRDLKYKSHFCSLECVHKSFIGQHHSPQTEFKKGMKALSGESHYLWQGGKSFEPYSPEFNKALKEQIRQRDNCTCQECKYTEKQLGYVLHPHHIDYDKKNNNPLNLISLCRSCHAKTNFKRENWTKYFQAKSLEL